MALAPSAALKDLGPLIFRQHALHLEEQVVLRRRADRPIEEDDLGAGALELFHQDDLIGIASGQAVGGMDIEAIHLAGGNRIDDCQLISAGRPGTSTVWVFTAGSDTFVPTADVLDVWEAGRS